LFHQILLKLCLEVSIKQGEQASENGEEMAGPSWLDKIKVDQTLQV
jgi:hypothetical protein